MLLETLFNFAIMRYLILFLIAFSSIKNTIAQNGFTKIADTKNVELVFKNKMENTQTMTGNFTQIKTMRLLNEKLQSKGNIYYKKTNKINISYTAPFTYEVRINNGQMMVKDQNKQNNKINTKNNSTLQSINQLILDCMTGNIFNNKDFVVTSFENKNEYLLSLNPTTASIKKMYKKIDVYFDKDRTNIKKLLITESNGDETIMQFSNLQYNTTVNESLFKI